MAKWDLSKLPEGRKPLPDEWTRRDELAAQMMVAIVGCMWSKADWAGAHRCAKHAYEYADAFLAVRGEQCHSASQQN